MAAEGQVVTGKVKFFNFKKGFGFVTRLDKEEDADLFVHRADIKGNPLKEGDEVTFLVKMDEEKKKEYAAEVEGGSGYPFRAKGERKGKGKSRGKGKGKGKGKKEDKEDSAADAATTANDDEASKEE